MSGDKMTPGDKAGEAAGAAKVTATEKSKTPLELKIDEWRVGGAIETRHASVIFAFFRQYPEVVLEVYDSKPPGAEIGKFLVRDGRMIVKKGINTVQIGINENKRFVVTQKSAELLGEFEYRRELAESQLSVISETRGFIKSRSEEAVKSREKLPEDTFGNLVCRILKRRKDGFVSYNTRAGGRNDEVEYVFQKCSKREAEDLVECAKKERLDYYKVREGVEILMHNDPREDELVNLLHNFGYNEIYCMPARVRVEKSCIMFFPAASGI